MHGFAYRDPSGSPVCGYRASEMFLARVRAQESFPYYLREHVRGPGQEFNICTIDTWQGNFKIHACSLMRGGKSAWICRSISALSPGQEGARPRSGHPRDAGCSGVPADHWPLTACVCTELGSLRVSWSGGENKACDTGIFALGDLSVDVCPPISLGSRGARHVPVPGLAGSGCLGQWLRALSGAPGLGCFWLLRGLNSGIWLSGVLLPHGLQFSLSPE